MAVLRKKDMEFYYKSDFALVVSLSDVLTNEVRVYTTDRKRYIVAEAEVIDEDTTRLWVRGNAESHILKPGRVNIEVWSRSGDVMLVALYWLEVWLSPTEVPEGQMDVTALAPYAIVDAYDMAVSAGYTGTREEYMAALLSAGTPSVDVAYLVDGSLDKTFSELADAWEEGHMLCVIDDGDVLPLSGVYDDSLVFSQVIGDELMIVTLMDDDSVEADVSELGGGCFIVPVSLSGGGAYSTTVPFAEVLDAYDSGKVVMYDQDKMRWIAQHKAVRNNVTTLFATNVKYLGSWNNSDPNMSTLRHSSNEVVAVSAVDLQPKLTAGSGITIANNVISADIPDGAYIIDVDLDADPMTTTAVFADALAAFESGRQVWFAGTSGGDLVFSVPMTLNYGDFILAGITWMEGQQQTFTFTANGVSFIQTDYVNTTALSTALAGKQDITTLVEVTATGDVTQALDSGKFYRFGEVDSLTLTFTAPSAGLGMWGGKFTASASWSALGIPATIDEAAGNDTIAGGKTYEFNVLDGIIVIKEV